MFWYSAQIPTSVHGQSWTQFLQNIVISLSLNRITPIKGLGGNEKLPPCMFCTVGIIRVFHRALTHTPPQTTSPRWAVRPPYSIDSTNHPNPTRGRPSAGVGQGHCWGVSHKLINQACNQFNSTALWVNTATNIESAPHQPRRQTKTVHWGDVLLPRRRRKVLGGGVNSPPLQPSSHQQISLPTWCHVARTQYHQPTTPVTETIWMEGPHHVWINGIVSVLGGVSWWWC